MSVELSDVVYDAFRRRWPKARISASLIGEIVEAVEQWGLGERIDELEQFLHPNLWAAESRAKSALEMRINRLKALRKEKDE